LVRLLRHQRTGHGCDHRGLADEDWLCGREHCGALIAVLLAFSGNTRMSRVTSSRPRYESRKGPGEAFARGQWQQYEKDSELNHQMPYNHQMPDFAKWRQLFSVNNISIGSELWSPGKDHRFGKGRDAEPLQHVRAAHFDCAHGNAQIDCYLFIRSTREEFLEDYAPNKSPCDNAPILPR
jgi:hypothetical protein